MQNISLKIKKSPFSRLRKGKVRLTLLQPATENSKEGKAKQRTEIEGQYSIFLDIWKNTEYCQLWKQIYVESKIECTDGNKESRRSFRHWRKGGIPWWTKSPHAQALVHILLLVMISVTIRDGCLLQMWQDPWICHTPPSNHRHEWSYQQLSSQKENLTHYNFSPPQPHCASWICHGIHLLQTACCLLCQSLKYILNPRP